MAKTKQPPTDASWLASLSWSSQTPKSLQQAAASDPAAFAGMFAARLASRAGASNGLASATKDSLYLLGTSALGEAAAPSIKRLEIVHALNGKTGRENVKNRLAQWLKDQRTNAIPPRSPAETLELLAWCEALPRIATQVSGKDFLGLFQRLVDCLNGAAEQGHRTPKADSQGDLRNGAPKVPDELQAVLQAELMGTAARLFPELAGAARLRTRSYKVLEKTLTHITDANGVPTAGILPVLAPLLASLLRSTELAHRDGTTLWNPDVQSRMKKLLLNARRLIRPDGTFPFAPDDQVRKARTAFTGKKVGTLVTLIERSLVASHAGNGQATRWTGEPPAVESEKSCVAVLRTGWSSSADWLGVTWDQKTPVLELLCASSPLVSGPWKIKIKVDGRRVRPVRPPEQTCWLSDEDVDYLELHSEFAGGVILERHLLLARNDQFALLADSVLAPRGARIDVKVTLPLAPGVRLESERKTRGGWLRGQQRLARFAPLWLPQSRIEAAAGALEEKDRELVLRASAPGRRFFMPLVLEWGQHPGRAAVDWRALTVAEERRVVPGEVAAGYRFRIGSRHLLFYRSLGPRATRSVLGHQTRYQFVVGRFNEGGAVEPLLQVE